jgi:hypothetical protein
MRDTGAACAGGIEPVTSAAGALLRDAKGLPNGSLKRVASELQPATPAEITATHTKQDHGRER